MWLIVEKQDNPDVAKFAGPGEIIVDLTSGETRWGIWELEMLARKGGDLLDFDRGKFQVGAKWRPPWPTWVRFTPSLYVQGYWGYMESLETYDVYQRSIRVGLLFPG